MSKCPSCKSGQKKRIARSSFLKILFKSRIYKCNECKVKYIKVPFFSYPLIIKKGKDIN